MTMSEYYDFRYRLKDLYKNDTIAGDLACKVLEIRDKNRCVNSINVSIQEGGIIVEFDQKTPEKKRTDIVNKIQNSIGRFIVDNQDKISISQDSFDQIINNGNSFCDIYSVGDEVTFGLF